MKDFKVIPDYYLRTKVRHRARRAFGLFGTMLIVLLVADIIFYDYVGAMGNLGKFTILSIAEYERLQTYTAAVLCALGIYNSAMCMWWSAKRKKNLAETESVIKNGRRITCSVHEVIKNGRIFDDYKLILRYTDENGNEHFFNSGRLYFRPEKFLRGKETLDVFVDTDDYERCVIAYPGDFPDNGAFYYY